MKSAITALIVACVLLLIVGLRGGLAHDHHKPELNSWFEGLRSKGKTPCCDGSDYNRVEDPDWRSQDGKYQVRLKGEWHDVPDDAVVTEPNKVGHAMVWPVEYGGQIYIRCFMPGALA